MLALCVGILFFEKDQGKPVSVAVCDALSVPGALCLLLAALVLITGYGAFDGLGYVGAFLAKMLPGRGLKKIPTYHDYVTNKREQRIGKERISLWFYVAIGVVLIAAGFIAYGVIPADLMF